MSVKVCPFSHSARFPAAFALQLVQSKRGGNPTVRNIRFPCVYICLYVCVCVYICWCVTTFELVIELY